MTLLGQRRQSSEIITAPVQTQTTPWETERIFNFAGGMITDYPAATLGENQFVDLLNFLIDTDSRSLITRPQFQPIDVDTAESAATTAPLTFFWSDLRGSDTLLISRDAGADTAVEEFTSGTPFASILSSNLSDDRKVHFAKWTVNDLDDIIIANGKDAPLRFTGTGNASALGLDVPVDTHLTITGATAAAQCQITTSAAHGLSSGDDIVITGVVGSMGTDVLNGNAFIVDTVVDPTNFTIDDQSGSSVNTAGKTYTSGGTVHVDLTFTDASAANGRGILFTGTFSYCITNVYDSSSNTKFGESGPSGTHDILVSADADNPRQVTFHSGDLATDVVAVRIYRSPPDSPNGPFLFIGETDRSEDFIDAIPVGEEGIEAPLDDGTPPRLKYPVVAGGRMWGVGQNSSAGLTSKLMFSNLNQVDMFQTLSVFYLPDEITAIARFSAGGITNHLYVWTKDSMHFLQNADPINFDLLKISDRGCISHDAVADIGTGLVFPGKDNIYFFDGNIQSENGDYAVPIANGIKSKVEKIAKARWGNTTATLFRNWYIMSYTATGSVNSNTIALATHTIPETLRQAGGNDTNGWTRLNWVGNHLQLFNGILYHAGNAEKYIYEHGQSTGFQDFLTFDNFDDTPTDIPASITTKLYHMKDPFAEKIFKSLSLIGQSDSSTYQATVQINNNEFSRGVTLVLANDATVTAGGVFGSAIFGTAVFGEDNTGFRSVHVKIGKGARGKNAQLLFTSQASLNTKIIGIEISYRQAKRPA